MTVISEAGLRKIVRKKLMNEIGYKNVSSDVGTVAYDECDLSQLPDDRQEELVVKFAKHFLFNPQMKRATASGDKIYTDRHFISFITGFKNLSPDENIKYERDVRDYIRRNPEMIKKYVDLISFGITTAFGQLAPLYCTLVTGALGVGSALISKKPDKVEKDYLTVDSVGSAFTDRAKKVGQSFRREHYITDTSIGRSVAIICLFPSTTKKYFETRPPNPASAMIDFRSEKLNVENVITRPNLKPKDIFDSLYRNFVVGNISKKDTLLSELKTMMYDPEIQTPEHGDEIRGNIRDIFIEGVDFWNRKGVR